MNPNQLEPKEEHILQNDDQVMPFCTICMQPIITAEAEMKKCVLDLPVKPHFGCDSNMDAVMYFDFEYQFWLKQF